MSKLIIPDRAKPELAVGQIWQCVGQNWRAYIRAEVDNEVNQWLVDIWKSDHRDDDDYRETELYYEWSEASGFYYAPDHIMDIALGQLLYDPSALEPV